jgi:hypothetical protein
LQKRKAQNRVNDKMSLKDNQQLGQIKIRIKFQIMILLQPANTNRKHHQIKFPSAKLKQSQFWSKIQSVLFQKKANFTALGK